MRNKNWMLKAVSVISVAALSLTALSACGSGGNAESENGRVYYLNKKAEEQESWVKLGEAFEKETGIPVEIQVGGNDYDATLRSELAKSSAPTLFQADGPSFMSSYMKYAKDLSDSDIYGQLTDNYKDRALTNDEGKPVAIPYATESYGIIYNKALLQEYFDASWSTVKSIEEINNFDTLKTVADEIQNHKDDIGGGVKGAFSSAGLDSTSAFRYNFHLPSVPLYYEYVDDDVDMNKVPSSVKGTYVEQMKNIFDLYITDATVEPSALSGKTMDDSIAEFATGQAVFFQDGVWVYNQIKDQEVADEDLGVLPIYIGVDGEENQGLNQVISNYWCVNSQVSEKDQEATEQFLNWLVTSDTAREVISQDMGLVAPFKGFDEEQYQVDNPLVNANREYQEAGKTDVVSVPTVSHQWEQDLGSAELNYAQGTGSWDDVIKVFTDNWASEYALAYGE
ncbi:ABC transporter substrate-binding protein [Bifidobacterium oedipodis]|uniref:Multiple sugar ABC transporter n=1 Tax=Bifidobacterium oedipodis TaxID=2675322 RepID=A0A7Y0EPJ9_9BIFI|nr:ABC transporter substrate-binding protein [Bifidobacterium sp. DSM 109957]NMM94045.1 Multiple sugar ABC transporter [Bifidobacterium sp. DSM 109957]